MRSDATSIALAQTAIFVGGWFHISIAVFHLFFGRIFGWRTQLENLSPVNRSIMRVMNFCLIYIFLVVGAVSILEPKGAHETMAFPFFVSLFWLMRAVMQIGWFQLRHPASVALLIVFLIMSGLYGFAWADSRIPDLPSASN